MFQPGLLISTVPESNKQGCHLEPWT